MCISQYLKIQNQLFSWQIFSTSLVPVRNLLRTLLSPSNFFLLFWVGTVDMGKRKDRGNSLMAVYRNNYKPRSVAWTEQAECWRRQNTLFLWSGLVFPTVRVRWKFPGPFASLSFQAAQQIRQAKCRPQELQVSTASSWWSQLAARHHRAQTSIHSPM